MNRLRDYLYTLKNLETLRANKAILLHQAPIGGTKDYETRKKALDRILSENGFVDKLNEVYSNCNWLEKLIIKIWTSR